MATVLARPRPPRLPPEPERLPEPAVPEPAVEPEAPPAIKPEPVRGVSDKEQRQYEHIKEDAKKEGRYGKRVEEVAARTVMKQRGQKSHSRGK